MPGTIKKNNPPPMMIPVRADIHQYLRTYFHELLYASTNPILFGALTAIRPATELHISIIKIGSNTATVKNTSIIARVRGFPPESKVFEMELVRIPYPTRKKVENRVVIIAGVKIIRTIAPNL